MKQHNRVCATVDLDAVSHNMEQMRERLGGKASLIAVVKADGYGHGAIPIAEMFEEYPYVWGYAVACLDEAVQLREHGLKKPVLVLGCVFPDQYEEMVRLDIRPTVYTEEMAGQISEEAVRQGKKVRLHIKADTGMARLGFPVNGESADVIRRISALPNVELEGMFTHFAKADETDKTYTLMQHERFLEMIKLTKERGVTITYYDCDNSAGIIDFPDMKHDLARAGIAMYGMYPSGDVDKSAVDLRPALTLMCHL